MTEKFIESSGARIATESFGDPANTAILLIMGAMASMLWWPDEFCQALAVRGRHVIRYDNRDTGHSTKYPPGKPGYAFDDMAADAIKVLDGYGIGAAHVAGMSMGGMIAQIVALNYPSRVLSLTAISTSPVGADTSHLPQATQDYLDHSQSAAIVDWSDRPQVVDFIVRDARAIAGRSRDFDEARVRHFIERDYDRSGGLLSATNHFMVEGREDFTGRLPGLAMPLLVIHGTADPIFPVEHGAALANAVGGRLVRIDGGGHELHPDDWPVMLDAMTGHTGVARH